MKFLIGFFFVLFSIALHADISKYFKKCENKSDIHKMKNIDFIYLINLDKRPERLKQTLEALHPYGIYPYRFSAVNGYAYSVDELNDMGVTLLPGMKTEDVGIHYMLNTESLPVPAYVPINEYGKKYVSILPGEIGCLLSHLSILKDAFDSNYNLIWIMEDDIEVMQDPRCMPDLIDELNQLVGKNNWDILFTDADRRDDDGRYLSVKMPFTPHRPNYPMRDNRYFSLKRRKYTHFIQTRARCGTHSMIVNRSGIKKILDFYQLFAIFLPIDHDLYLINDLHLYSVSRDIISNRIGSISDTRPNMHRNNLYKHELNN
jgi:GR25 family glycosyltransferase involved in LPS biosynthesis